MVEEQRRYDDTRALPQQSSMFGDHAEAPVVEPLFGSVEERQQEDERRGSACCHRQQPLVKKRRRKLGRPRKTRAERLSTPRRSASKPNASKLNA